ncbi:8048_t:CDS:2 [Ambispora gerdemannii]|uniref:8048_t:CDS:1 n=1 Tax=Ambispora gerdemannii TaxID=144530 RepID=A0A9N8VEK5_9GLOM|nr:8048_t:CDS:2 [Ambispora gerdemannii]
MASHNLQGHSPRDAKIISLILSSVGVEEYEPKVVQQLLEFAHRYSVDVLQDALIYSEHAGRINDLDLEDVKLAIQGRVNHSFTSPPSKEFLVELAREVNKERLPNIPEKYGLRLPPEHYCMTAVNFQLIPETQESPTPQQTSSSLFQQQFLQSQQQQQQFLGPEDPTPPSTSTQTPFSTTMFNNVNHNDDEDYDKDIITNSINNDEDQAGIERTFKQDDDNYDEDDEVNLHIRRNDDDNNEDNVILKFDLPSSSFSSFVQQSPPSLPLQNLSNNDELFSPANEDYDMQEAESTTQSTVTSPATVGTEGYKRPRNEEDDNYDF